MKKTIVIGIIITTVIALGYYTSVIDTELKKQRSIQNRLEDSIRSTMCVDTALEYYNKGHYDIAINHINEYRSLYYYKFNNRRLNFIVDSLKQNIDSINIRIKYINDSISAKDKIKEFDNLFNTFKNRKYLDKYQLDTSIAYWEKYKLITHKNYKYRNDIVYKNFRKQWYEIMRNELWKDDFEFALYGNNDILVVSHPSCVLNSYKQKVYDALSDKLYELKFKQLRVKSYLSADEYTYWDLH